MVELTAQTLRPDNEITMLRVLMVLEDYGELMYLQTVLKKIGFDVDAIQNPRSFQEHLLQMNPDVLLMTAYGKRVNGLHLAKGTKKVRGMPGIILLRSPGQSEDRDPTVDTWLETPASAPTLLDAIAHLRGLDSQMLQEKFKKLKLSDVEALQPARVLKAPESSSPRMERGEDHGNFGVLKSSKLSVADRQARYQSFLTEPMPEKHGFALKQVQDQVRALRKEEHSADLEELERQRKLFVEHLFKNKG